MEERDQGTSESLKSLILHEISSIHASEHHITCPLSYLNTWVLRCILYEMCNLRHAFDAQSLNVLAVKILKGSYPALTTTYSKQLRDLITKMSSINPKQRLTIWYIINKSFIKKKLLIIFTRFIAEITLKLTYRSQLRTQKQEFKQKNNKISTSMMRKMIKTQ